MTSLRDIHRDHARRRPAGSGRLVVWRDADGREHTRSWPRALPAHRSSCRHDASKGVHQHRCSRSHAEMVDGYRAIREAEEAAAEAATSGYETELASYWAEHPRTTFKDYLMGMRDTARAYAA